MSQGDGIIKNIFSTNDYLCLGSPLGAAKSKTEGQIFAQILDCQQF